MQRKNIIIGLVIVLLLLAAGGYFFILNDNSTSNDSEFNNDPIDTSFPDDTEPVPTEDPIPEEPEPDEETEDEPVKTDNPPVSDEQPRVYTGFGHAEDNPLKLDQTTSTTCTASPGTTCFIKLINSSGNEKVFKEKTTNSQGVAAWRWQGKDVGEGTWSVYAISGDKQSTKELLYIGS